MAPLQRSKPAIQADQLQIQHFTHQHLLHKLYMTVEFSCDGCNTGGCGVRYRCSTCDFDLHEQCATSPHRISSHLHPHHQLILVNRPGDSHSCHVCKGFTNGLCYTCESQTCEFNVHPLCIQIQAATVAGVPSLTLDPCKKLGGVSWGQPTTAFGGYNGANNINNNHNQPVMINQQHQQMQGIPTMVFGGYQGVNNSQAVMVNQQQKQMQGMPTTAFGGHHGANNNQTQIINHHKQQGIPTTAFGGYNGVNNSQPVIVSPYPQQGMPAMTSGGYNGANNSQPVMVNHHHQQQQGITATASGGYNAVNNSQPLMVNHQQQHPGMPTTAFAGYNGVNTNQQLMINQHQQQQGIPSTATGGYSVVNNNQTVMINQQQPQPQQQQPVTPNNYAKVGKIAANILSTSLIGIPIFNPRT